MLALVVWARSTKSQTRSARRHQSLHGEPYLLNNAHESLKLRAAALVDDNGGGEVTEEPGRIDLNRPTPLLLEEGLADPPPPPTTPTTGGGAVR